MLFLNKFPFNSGYFTLFIKNRNNILLLYMYTAVTSIKRNDCSRVASFLFKRKNKDENNSALTWLPPYTYI